MHVLVVGGAGYIGSITAEQLLAAGERVTIFDNLSTGHREAVPEGATLVVGDLADAAALDRLFGQGGFDAVLHFAAKSIVPHSMEDPGSYFFNNVSCVIGLLNAMQAHAVRKFVFSSSAAVYGEPDTVPITEDAPLRPNNPYGTSKAVVEQLLRWYGSQRGLRYAALRYFNAAGASVSSGEDHRPETHLLPLALQTAAGQRGPLTIFGEDYPTSDGTAVRDYIHVLDLADAHIRALRYLDKECVVCNLGNGVGYSVRQIVDTVRQVTGVALPVVVGQRRAGDAPITIAQADRAGRLLGWQPTRGLDEMVESAWKWQQRYPKGYDAQG